MLLIMQDWDGVSKFVGIQFLCLNEEGDSEYLHC